PHSCVLMVLSLPSATLAAAIFPYTPLFRSGVADGKPVPAELEALALPPGSLASALVQMRTRIVEDGDKERAINEHNARTRVALEDRKSTRLNSSHVKISYAVFCLKTKINPH